MTSDPPIVSNTLYELETFYAHSSTHFTVYSNFDKNISYLKKVFYQKVLIDWLSFCDKFYIPGSSVHTFLFWRFYQNPLGQLLKIFQNISALGAFHMNISKGVL